MRSVPLAIVAVVLGGCLMGSLDANSRPSVMPKLSELPEEREQRDAVLDQSGERARPEQRKSMTKRERKVETMAAVAAALIGDAFSTTKNVTIGVATDVDENRLFEKAPQKRPAGPKGAQPDGEAPAAGELVPWIKLDPKSRPADIDSAR